MDDAVTALRHQGVGIQGAFVWHGWDNGDGFDFWAAANRNGSAKELRTLADAK